VVMACRGGVPAHQPLGVPGLTTLPSRNGRQVGDRQSPGGLAPVLGMNGANSFSAPYRRCNTRTNPYREAQLADRNGFRSSRIRSSLRACSGPLQFEALLASGLRWDRSRRCAALGADSYGQCPTQPIFPGCTAPPIHHRRHHLAGAAAAGVASGWRVRGGGVRQAGPQGQAARSGDRLERRQLAL
jgi:hypothetical protein